MSGPPRRTSITQVKHYRLLDEIGSGSMGSVYEGIDGRDSSRVAIKILHPELIASDPTFRDRFEREAHIAALLRSPYTVHLLDFGQADGSYYLVMEYVDGHSLGKELENGPLDPARALRIAAEVARALEEAAARGVAHRDIKPENILLAEDGRVKVADFGIARQAGGGSFTMVGQFVGTPDFAAPEQFAGEADHRSDIYALGATLYCMLTGHPPFQARSALEVLRMHQNARLPMAALDFLPDPVINTVRRCLEKDQRDRYQSATELAGALERALATLPSARNPSMSPAPTVATSTATGSSQPAGPGEPRAVPLEAASPASPRERPTIAAPWASGPEANAAAAPSTSVDDLACPNCGTFGLAESRFCGGCGSPLPTPPNVPVVDTPPNSSAAAPQPAANQVSAREQQTVLSDSASPPLAASRDHPTMLQPPESSVTLVAPPSAAPAPDGGGAAGFANWANTLPSPAAPPAGPIPAPRRSRAALVVGAGVGLALVGVIALVVINAGSSSGGEAAAPTLLPSAIAGGGNSTAVATTTAGPGSTGPRTVLKDTFDSNTNGWSIGSTSSPLLTAAQSLSGGKYRFEVAAVTGGTVWAGVPRIDPLQDFTLNVEARRVSGPTDSSYGVVFRWAADGANYYYFAISDVNQFSVRSYASGAGFTPIVDWADTPTVRPGQVNRLQVVARGDHFTFSVNGERVADVSDPRLQSGNVGLIFGISHLIGQPVYEFDNFEVTVP